MLLLQLASLNWQNNRVWEERYFRNYKFHLQTGRSDDKLSNTYLNRVQCFFVLRDQPNLANTLFTFHSGARNARYPGCG